MTLTLLAGFVVDEAGRRLASMVGEAMRRADVTQDYVARCTGIPPARLSDQLAGKVPFTGLCRILSNREIRSETDLWVELADLFADAVERTLAPRDYTEVISRLARIEDLIGRPRMARMELPATAEEKAS